LSLVYSGGPYRNDLYAALTTRQGLLTAINTSLIAAGWTSTNAYSFLEFFWTGQPVAGQSVTVAGTVYTYQAVVGVANTVLIGANGSASARNLYDAINKGPGEGTTYGTGTVANANMSAADYISTGVNSGQMRIQARNNATPFGIQGTLAVSRTTSNQTISYGTNALAGYIWDSAITPAGMQTRLYGLDAGESSFSGGAVCRLYQMDINEKYRSQPFTQASNSNNSGLGWRLAVGTYSTWRIIATPYHVFAFANGAAAPTGNNSAFFAGVPYVLSFLTATRISNATNTSPIVITTTTAHGYSSAENIFTTGILGNAAANGTNAVTVLTPTSYSIPVAGDGTYISGGVCARPIDDKVALAMIGSGDDAGGVMFAYTRFGAESSQSFQNLNGSSTFGTTNNVGAFSILTAAPSRIQDAGQTMQFADGTRAIYEPHLAMSGSFANKARWMGQMYDTMVTADIVAQGTTAVVDSRNWYCLGQQAGSTSIARGSIWVVVP
jgi:hypothetical protein